MKFNILTVASLHAIISISSLAYDLRYAFPNDTDAIVGTLPNKASNTYSSVNWHWNDTCFNTSEYHTYKTTGCYWYANTNFLDKEWITDNTLKYMFNNTRNGTYKYMHVHIHEQGAGADADFMMRTDIHNEM